MTVQTLHHDEPVMGTVVSFDLYPTGLSREREFLALVAARKSLHHVDAVFSTYRENSPISRLRRGEITLDEAPVEVAEVLSICTAVRELTDGWFDPWALPGGVDPSGLVKGWSVERALEVLETNGVAVASVNAGGDISTIGAITAGLPWRFGVQDPFDPSRLVAVVDVKHAIATSGTYERGQHLYNPNLKRFSCAVASSTVIGADLGIADGLATALAVSGVELLGAVERAGYAAFIIEKSGAIVATSNFPFAPRDLK
jgi:thiamine biosynthesis lipoprotein